MENYTTVFFPQTSLPNELYIMINKILLIFGQMPPASDLGTGHVSIIVMPNSLNIHFTGIHALGDLFSVKSYKT